MLYLLIRDEGSEREALLKPGLLRVGRLATNDLVVTSDDVSREHAELRLEHGEVHVRDLGASNGTFLESAGGKNGRRPLLLAPEEWHALVAGDVVRLGTACWIEIRETLHLPGIREAEPTAPRSGVGDIRTLVPDHPSTGLLRALATLAESLPSGSTAPEPAALDALLSHFVESLPLTRSALLVGRAGAGLRVLASTMDSGEALEVSHALPLALAEEALSGDSGGVRWAAGDSEHPAQLPATVACRGDASTALVLGLSVTSAGGRAEPSPEIIAVATVAARLFASALRADASHAPTASDSEARTRAPLDVTSLFGGIIPSSAFRTLLEQAARVAGGTGPILIAGQTGVGKELIARFLHQASARRGAFVEASVGALAPTLVESELFGHVKGAFTDATSGRAGLLEQAHGGTLFLDEIGEVPLEVQHKLLRALQERTFRRVGSNETEAFDALIVAATNRNLEAEVAAGRFREDLYYRLNMMEVRVPPLRDRPGEIAVLADGILRALDPSRSLDVRALDWLLRQPWPGNVRQLRNVLERAVRLHDASVLRPEHFGDARLQPIPLHLAGAPLDWREALDAFEKAWCEMLWAASGSRMSEAARLSGLDRSNVRRRMKDHGLVGGGGDEDTVI